MISVPLVFYFPALPVLGQSHALFASDVEALGPLLGRCWPETQCFIELS